MKRWQKVVIWSVVVGFAAGGIGLFTFQRFSPPPKGSSEEVVLVVEGQEFTRAQLGQTLQNVLAYYRQLYQLFGMDFDAQLRGTDGAYRIFQFQGQAAEVLIRQVIIQNEARRLRVSVPKAELDKAVEARYQQALQQVGGNEETLKLYLQAQNLTLARYKELLRQNEEYRLTEEKLKATVVGAIEPTDAELQRYLTENQSLYQTEPEKVKVGHILVSDPKLADDLLARAQAPGADFAALARTYSEDQATKEKGGETAFFARYESPFSTTVTDVVWDLNVGEVRLVKDDQGYHIVKLLERRPPVVPPLEEIRDRVRQDYVRAETDKRWNAWYEEKRAKVKLEVRDPVLFASLLYPKDKEAALTKLRTAQEEGYALDLYLPYYLGRLYEERYTEVLGRRVELENKEGRTPAEEEELSRLKTQEAEYKAQALAQYLKFMESGEGDEAFFNRVLLLDPQNVRARFQLAELYRQGGRYAQADAEYSRVVEADPTFVAAWVGRGDNAMAMQLYTRAAEFYAKALELQPGSLTLKLKLAEAYLRGRRTAEARPILEEVLKAQADNATALVLMGDLLLAEGKAAEAVDYYTRAWQRSPTPDVQLKLAQALAQAGRTEEALRRFQDLIQRSPYNAQARLGYADLLLAQGQREKALEEYQNALRFAADVETREKAARQIVALNPNDIAMRFRLAGYLREQYKYDGAIAQYEAILALDPQNLDALIGLGDCYVPKTQYDRALEYYRQALALATASSKKIEIYGKIVACEEQRVGTHQPLTAAGLEALWNRALLYKDLGQYAQALADLQRLQKTAPEYRSEEVKQLIEELSQPQPR